MTDVRRHESQREDHGCSGDESRQKGVSSRAGLGGSHT